MSRERTGQDSSTKSRILDAAEYLFARDGYRGTSLRSITGRAAVNLAAVNYHFGSKKKLVEDVITRRLLPLNAARRKRLEKVNTSAALKGKKPEIKEVLAAFIEPTLMFRESTPGAEHFFTFIGRSFTDPDERIRDVFIRQIKPLFQLFFDSACRALPDYPAHIIFWRLHFTMGALFHTLHISGNIKTKFHGIHTDMEASSLINLIIPYVTAGMKA